MTPQLPRLPALDPNLLLAHERAHVDLDEARGGVDPAVDLVFRRFAVETTGEAIAGIPPSFRGGVHPALLPAPRAFLSTDERTRIEGVHAGLRHVDSRLAMWVLGHDSAAFRPESPYVLHALTEGPVANPQITNPGMLRATPVWQASEVFDFPDATAVPALFEEMVARTITSSPAPACARAAWLLLTTVFLHPFCDGNGRVSRLLYLLVAGEALPSQFDWGVAEQWAFRREAFAQVPRDARALDASLDLTPLASFVVKASVDGATLMRRRVGLFADLRAELARMAQCTDDEATVALALAIRRQAELDALAADLDCHLDAALDHVTRLIAAGVVRRVRTAPSRRTSASPLPSFAITAAAAARADAVVGRALANPRRAHH